MDKDDKIKLFLAQYTAVSEQVIHWDTFFWSKSRFFLAVEGVALLGIGQWIVESIKAGSTYLISTHLFLFGMLVTVPLLNLYLCLVWLRTGMCNREFLNTRFEIGTEMERLVDDPIFQLYTFQKWKSDHLIPRKSHKLEIFMPVAFGAAWIFVLFYFIWVFIAAYFMSGNIQLRAAEIIPVLVSCLSLAYFLWMLDFSVREARAAWDDLPEEVGVRDKWQEFQKHLQEKDTRR